MDVTLLEATKILIQRSGLSVNEICENCEGVSRDWFYKFKRGDIPDPSVNKIQSIHDYLIKAGRANE